MRKVQERALPMKLIDGEYSFDRSKIILYFSAEGRIDFRELVKDLAHIFRVRIALKQIGERDDQQGIGQHQQKAANAPGHGNSLFSKLKTAK